MSIASIDELRIDIGPLHLQCGARLDRVVQQVTTYGDPASPAVFVPHALTGSSHVTEWWGELVGEGKFIDPRRAYVIGINALGGCYGSTGPVDGEAFPYVTVRDIVAAQARALDTLGVERLALTIGASLGGMQALQCALDYPERVERAVIVGAHDHQSAMGIALNAVQREAIDLDPIGGLRLARKIAMLSYKSDALLRERHDRRPDRKNRFRFDVEGYLEYQADLFEARMDPHSYVALTQSMDSFDVRNRAAAPRCGNVPRLLFVGISSDWLFLPQDVRAAADRFRMGGYDSAYAEIDSNHGHDAFLAEPRVFSELLAQRGIGF